MKVALFVHCFFPDHYYGTEVYTLEIARNLREMGHEPIIVSAIFLGEPGTDEFVSNYEFEGFPVYCLDKNHYPYKRIKDTYYQPELREHLKSVLYKIKPDIIHVTHLINHTAVLLEVAEELGLPTVATLTDFYGICYNSQLKLPNEGLCHGPNALRSNCIACRLRDEATFPNAPYLLRKTAFPTGFSLGGLLLRLLFILPRFQKGQIGGLVGDIIGRPNMLSALYKKYRAVIAPTTFLKEAYVRNGLTGPIHKSSFGVDIGRHPKKERDNVAPVKFGYIGQIAPHKGTDLLIDAFSQLPADVASLDIYGDEKQFVEFTTKIKNMAEGSQVSFNGTFPKEKIDEILLDFDFLVIPSTWYENSPLVLLNALACHTPVIVSDVAGMTEFVEDGKNGFVFKRGSVKELKKVLETIVADPVRARNLSKTTEYLRTTKMMAEDVVEVYKMALER
jgi:glycosyltransferase involved in cell wall biosynthesis